MMIGITIEVKVDKNIINVPGFINDNYIELSYICDNTEEVTTIGFELDTLFKAMTSVLGSDGFRYSIYGVTSGKSGDINNPHRLFRTYYATRIVRELHCNEYYSEIYLSIVGIENLVHSDKFEINIVNNNVITRFNNKYITVSEELIAFDTKYRIIRRLEEFKEDLNSVNMRSKTFIHIVFNESKGIEDLIDITNNIKLMFEWIVGEKLIIDSLEFHKGTHIAVVTYDSYIITGESYPKNYFMTTNLYGMINGNWTNHDILIWIDRWIHTIYKYKEVFDIWKKSIYNICDIGDEFTWVSRALELLAWIEVDILDKSRVIYKKERIEQAIKSGNEKEIMKEHKYKEKKI